MRHLLVLSLSALLLASCGGGQSRTNNTATMAATTATSLQNAGLSLDSLVQNLTNFRGATATADLKNIYKSFVGDHDAVSKSIAMATKSAEGTEASARAQLEAWNKEIATIQDPELRG
jgi:hypothetical protein